MDFEDVQPSSSIAPMLVVKQKGNPGQTLRHQIPQVGANEDGEGPSSRNRRRLQRLGGGRPGGGRPEFGEKVQGASPPSFGLEKSIRAWFLHPYLSRVIVEVSDSRTLPHVDGLFTGTYKWQQPEVFSSMADGSEWLEPLHDS